MPPVMEETLWMIGPPASDEVSVSAHSSTSHSHGDLGPVGLRAFRCVLGCWLWGGGGGWSQTCEGGELGPKTVS